MYNLFLDDERQPKDVTWVNLPCNKVWVVVRSYYEFIKQIKEFGLPDFVTLDHDLADEHYYPISILGINDIPYSSYKEKTGMDCCKWLVNYCIEHSKKLPKWEVHSMNCIGKENISKYLEGFERSCQ